MGGAFAWTLLVGLCSCSTQRSHLLWQAWLPERRASTACRPSKCQMYRCQATPSACLMAESAGVNKSAQEDDVVQQLQNILELSRSWRHKNTSGSSQKLQAPFAEALRSALNAPQATLVELGNATTQKISDAATAVLTAEKRFAMEIQNATKNGTAEITREIIAIIESLQEKSIAALYSGVPVYYNVTFSPLGLWLGDLVEMPVVIPNQTKFGSFLERMRQFLRVGDNASTTHEANRFSIQCGDLVACSLEPRSDAAEVHALDSAAAVNLSRGDTLLIRKADWQSLLKANATFFEQQSLDQLGEGPKILIACQIYDSDGRHTERDQNVLRSFIQSADENIRIPRSTSVALQKLLRSLDREAVATQTLARARRFDFLENRLWMHLRNRSRFFDQQVAKAFEKGILSPLAGLFYVAPTDVFAMQRNWNDLSQHLKLRLRCIVCCLLRDPAKFDIVETESHAIACDIMDRANLRRERLGLFSTLVEGERLRRMGGLVMMLAVRLCLVRRNLGLPGLLSILDAAAPRLPPVLGTLLNTHKNTVFPWVYGLESAYLCLATYWTPSMYFVPILYLTSLSAASILETYTSFAEMVANVEFLLSTFPFLDNLLNWGKTWLLTPAINVVVIISQILKTAVKPIGDLIAIISQGVGRPFVNAIVSISQVLKAVVQPIGNVLHLSKVHIMRWLKWWTTSFKSLSKSVGSFRRVSMNSMRPVSALLRPLKASARVILSFGRFVLESFEHFLEYPGMIARGLKGREIRRMRAAEQQKGGGGVPGKQ